MSATRRARLNAAFAVVPLLVACLVVGLPTPGTSAGVTEATFSVSPKTFTGGQVVTYSGNVGVPGIVVKLQGSQRPGAPWNLLGRTRSNADGSYSIRQPAPSMRGIQRRVVAQGVASNVIRMNAQSQDLVLVPVGTPAAGHTFQVMVSTVPGPYWGRGHPFFVMGRPDLPAPVFEGRELTLQKRGPAGEWQDVPGGTTTTDRAGVGTFSVTEGEAGTTVFRVRQEDYPQAGAPAIGWFPSFPTPISIAPDLESATTYDRPSLVPARPLAAVSATPDADLPPAAARRSGPAHGFNAVTAQDRMGWGGVLWDFGLPQGESLTSPPSRGSHATGWWLDGSNGTGRANPHNGGIALFSQRYAPDRGEDPDAGDKGSTWVTLQDNARRYGRWEARIRLRPYERAKRDYRGKIELVPANAAQDDCGARDIVVADLAAHSSRMRIGVNSGRANRAWRASRRIGNIENHPVAVAVEVTKRHVTWFFNGRPVGSVRSRAAVPRVPLTMRITLQGSGDREMNRTMAHMDWIRGFSLRHGNQTTRGGHLRARRYGGGC